MIDCIMKIDVGDMPYQDAKAFAQLLSEYSRLIKLIPYHRYMDYEI